LLARPAFSRRIPGNRSQPQRRFPIMKRFLTLFIVAVLFDAGAAFACRSDDVFFPSVTTFHNSLNPDLIDYGTFFEEAAPWSGCIQAAADGLYKKLYLTLNSNIWPFADPQVGMVGPYNRWLSGGDIALIHATALRLANSGKLSKPLDDLI